MININDLYWLAGIIEGEGYMFLCRRSSKRNREMHNNFGALSFATRIGVGNTDVGIIKKMSEIFIDLGIRFYYSLHNNKYPGAKQYICINVMSYKSCLKLLDAITEKMSNSQKKLQANEMIKYIKYRLSKVAKRNEKGAIKEYSSMEEYKNIDEVFAKKIHDLKTPSILPSTTKRVASTIISW